MMVRWKARDFDDDTRPGAAERGDVLPCLEGVLLSRTRPTCQKNGRPEMTDRRRRPEMTDQRQHVRR